MAGYKVVGDEEFVNATVYNSQGDRQRQRFFESNASREIGSKRETLGVGRNDADNSVFPQLDKDAIFQQAVDFFADADLSVDAVAANPDFRSVVDMSAEGSLTMFDDVNSKIDKPNLLGPNMVVPDVNNLSLPTDTRVGRDESQLNRGYGSEKKYKEGEDRIGSYFKKHYQYGTQVREADPILGTAVPGVEQD